MRLFSQLVYLFCESLYSHKNSVNDYKDLIFRLGALSSLLEDKKKIAYTSIRKLTKKKHTYYLFQSSQINEFL